MIGPKSLTILLIIFIISNCLYDLYLVADNEVMTSVMTLMVFISGVVCARLWRVRAIPL